MKKKTYYQTVYQRHSALKETVLALFLSLSSWPRMLLEVPIRSHFGERYFKFSTAISIVVTLSIVPFGLIAAIQRLHGGSNFSIFMEKFVTWYLYLAAFTYYAIQRREEIKRLPGVFDFERFSKSTGLIHRRFWDFEYNGRRFDARTIETLLEPGLFFIIGIVLWFSGQPIGFLLVICSIFYSLSYVAAYDEGDNWLMDKIDERICNEELVKTFMDNSDPAQSRGFNFYGRRPADPDARRRIADMFMDDEETVEAV